MKQNDFRGIAVAVVVFALGIIAVGFTGCDFLEDYINMKPAEEPPTVDLFSGDSEVEGDSLIDAIRAAKQAGDSEVLSLTWTGANEVVTLSGDLTGGLVLDSTNSPANVTIDGTGGVVDLTGSPGSPLITVENGVTLTLKNITFKGMANNTRPLVLVNTGGTLVMDTGAVITGNTNGGCALTGWEWEVPNNAGGGVMVSGGVFKMKDGATISGNTSTRTVENIYASYPSSSDTYNRGGGGVGVVNDGEFIMEGGTISGNVVLGTGTSGHLGGGGGVMVYQGTFKMEGGDITSNEANGNDPSSTSKFTLHGFGGGVSVNGWSGLNSNDNSERGTFLKTAGSIKDNTADGSNNQVFVLLYAYSSYVYESNFTYVSRNTNFDDGLMIEVKDGSGTDWSNTSDVDPGFDDNFWEKKNQYVYEP